jgi:hypothetical protein
MRAKRATLSAIYGIVALGLGLSGCAKVVPYTVEPIDLSGPQQRAAILIKDPQVYSRATLINDRKNEEQYLKALLDKQKDPSEFEFKPQVLRELSDLSAFSASLGLSFNPAQGATAAQAAELNRLKFEIEKARLERELIIAEKRRAAIEAADLPKEELTPGQPGEPLKSLEAPAAPNIAAINTRLSELKGKLDTLLTQVGEQAKTRVPKLREAEARISPRDQFLDFQAYRAELRTALNAARLDDRHDDAGNTLYRLAFKTTVLPGEIQNKWGAARLTLKGPDWDQYTIRELYYSWLGYLASRLNYPSQERLNYPSQETKDPSHNPVKIDANFFSLAIATGFVEVFLLPFQLDHRAQTSEDECSKLPLNYALTQSRCGVILLPVSVGTHQLLSDLYQDGALYRFVSQWRQVRQLRPSIPLSPLQVENIIRSVKTVHRELSLALKGAALGLRFADTDQPIGVTVAIQHFLLQLEQAHLIANSISSSQIEARDDAPDFNFNETICKDMWTGSEKRAFACLVTGTGRTVRHSPTPAIFDVAPIELAQRRSTVASKAASYEVALAIAAALPNSGVSADTALGYLRTVAGNVEALERVPLVLGFADIGKQKPGTTYDSNNPTRQPPARFGWLFGPQMEVDVKKAKIRLVQRPADYEVFTDISIPAWWPYITLESETAWIGDWKHGTDVFADCGSLAGCAPKDQAMHVNLPVTPAGLNALTEFILRARGRNLPNPPNITRLTPSTVSACTDSVTFVIEGSNLWRGVDVYAGGVALSKVEVLPDMRGIKATLTMMDILKNVTNADTATPRNAPNTATPRVDVIPISVVTRDGVTTRRVAIQGQRWTTQVNGQATTSCNAPLIADEILHKDVNVAGKAQQISEASRKTKSSKKLF